MLPFSLSEYARRLERTRSAMTAQGLAAVIVTDASNLFYLTGYAAWTFYTPQCLYVPLVGDLLLFTRAMDDQEARLTTCLSGGQIVAYPESYVQQPDRHPMSWIAAELVERGINEAVRGGVVGLDNDSYNFSARAYGALRGGLPTVRFADSRDLVAWVRAVKSPAELEYIRRAAKISNHSMSVAIDAVQPGRRANDVIADSLAAQVCGTQQFAGDYPAVVPIVTPAAGTKRPHRTQSDRRFASDEAIIIELAGVHRRYHAPLIRTVMLGKPTPALVEAALVAQTGLHTALNEVRPGTTCEQIARVWHSATGIPRSARAARIGYSVGIGFPPDWGEHTMSLRMGETTRLAANMTLHLIASVWLDGWGCEMSETLIVTGQGADCLASLPRELMVKTM